MYSREVIDEVISRNDIVDVISGYVKLKKNGSSYTGLCPFHNEKSPSFSVSGQRQLYHCFGCGAGGNVITFVMEYENMTFLEAVKMLGERAGVALPQTSMSEEDRKERGIRDRLLEINKIAATYYYRQLRSENGKAGLDYLKKRELSDSTINSFGLGYATQSTGNLYKLLKDKGYDDDILKESGLFTYERGIHEKFWNRVIFPIMDINNKVIGFGGRVMGDAKPKYLNSPETRLFDKSRNLYGLNIARMSRKPNMIICEGYMDVISMHQAGFNQAIPILKEAGLSTKVINMRPYKDPDEFIKAMGAEAFQERIDNAENSFMYEIGTMLRNYDRGDPESETAFEREVAAKLVTFKEKLERDNYLKAVCRQFMIPEDGMRQMVSRLGNQEGIISRNAGAGTMQPTVERKPKKKREDGLRQAEKMLLTWLISDRDIFDKVAAYIKPEDFIDPLFSGVAEKVYEQYGTGNISPAAIIADYATTEEHTEVAAMFSADLDESLNNLEREKTLNDIVIRIKANSLNHELNKTVDPKRMQEIIIEQQKLNQIHIKL